MARGPAERNPALAPLGGVSGWPIEPCPRFPGDSANQPNPMTYQLQLIDGSGGRHEPVATIDKDYTQTAAQKQATALNSYNGYTYGGFGLYYKPVRKKAE